MEHISDKINFIQWIRLKSPTATGALLGGILLYSALTQAGSGPRLAPWEGLPETLTASLVQDLASTGEFTSFAPQRIGQAAPIATGWIVDGTSYPGMFAEIEPLIFEQRHWISLPKGTRIRESSSEARSLQWEFPLGTRLIHEIRWRAQATPLFEIRMIQKTSETRWAFGSFLPQPDGSALLAQRLEFEGESASVQLDSPIHPTSPISRFQFRRISTKTCASCHLAVSPQLEAGPQHAGPCGFVPQNEGLKSWSESFERKFGYWPFEASVAP